MIVCTVLYICTYIHIYIHIYIYLSCAVEACRSNSLYSGKKSKSKSETIPVTGRGGV
jgi:hypothetical protein